jgi:hypothetical protein
MDRNSNNRRFNKDRDVQRRQPRQGARRQGTRSAVVRFALSEA